LLREAITAINRSLTFRLKGYFSLLPAIGTGGRKILSGAAGGGFSGVSATLAPLRLVLEPALGIELLLTGCECEFFATLFALDILVFVHVGNPLFK